MAQDKAEDLALLTATVAGQPTGEPPKRADQFLAKRQRRVAYGILAPGGIYLLIAFIVPLILVVYTSLQTGGLLSGGYTFTWAFDNYVDAFSSSKVFIIRAVLYAGLATLFGILLAYPMAYWIAFYAGKWKSTLFFLILVPFFVSFVIRTVQWNFILADDGVLFGPLKSIGLLPEDFRVLASPVAVVAGLTYNFLPFTALPLYVALERIDKSLVEAAKDLYASRFEAFRKVVLPLSYPGLFAALVLSFVPATGDYVNSGVLGSNRTTMVGQVIQTKFLTEADYPEAAALSVILMLGMLVIALAYAKALGTEDAALAAGAA
ncbi:MAG TPA: ABC transporter permease [Actinomycetota bacterium]|nr:ABC transporter permease [Actinomycetota bacterium]